MGSGPTPGSSTGSVLVRGDHIRDMEAARAAGMTAVAVGYGYISEGDDYRQWPADVWFDDCTALVTALNAF